LALGYLKTIRLPRLAQGEKNPFDRGGPPLYAKRPYKETTAEERGKKNAVSWVDRRWRQLKNQNLLQKRTLYQLKLTL